MAASGLAFEPHNQPPESIQSPTGNPSEQIRSPSASTGCIPTKKARFATKFTALAVGRLPWSNPRHILFACAGLDLVGVFAGVALINSHTVPDLIHPVGVLFFVGFVYGLFSWLLGSYTVLRWPWLRLRLVLQRVGLTALASLVFLVLCGWAFNLNAQHLALFNRRVLLELLFWQSAYALALRLAISQIARFKGSATWQLMAAPEHQLEVVREWERNPFVRPPRLLSPDVLVERGSNPSPGWGVVVGPSSRLNQGQRLQLTHLQTMGLAITTIEELAERQLERLPPNLLPDRWFTYQEMRWSNELSFQRKLKRTADVLLSIVLLSVTAPLLLLIPLLIWLDDQGPVLYTQPRTGLLGKEFSLLKFRTMRWASHTSPTPWTCLGDSRITKVGSILRRTRLDELPQLINVLNGEMSLIGPRPEQPHLDENLSQAIPHYRKRYWMLPGLSGWAQVCGPAYPASMEESELKLSYDLFYLRNWNTWLDLLIMAKTVKTLLRVRGR